MGELSTNTEKKPTISNELNFDDFDLLRQSCTIVNFAFQTFGYSNLISSAFRRLMIYNSRGATRILTHRRRVRRKFFNDFFIF